VHLQELEKPPNKHMMLRTFMHLQLQLDCQLKNTKDCLKCSTELTRIKLGEILITSEQPEIKMLIER